MKFVSLKIDKNEFGIGNVHSLSNEVAFQRERNEMRVHP